MDPWQNSWDLPPLPPKRRRGRGLTGLLTVLVSLLLIVVVVLVAVGLLGGVVDFGVNGRTGLQAQTTQAPEYTFPPRAPGEPPRLPLAGRVRGHYQRLAPEEQRAYDIILAQLPGFPEEIEIPHLGANGVSDVFYALLRDNPMIFHLSSESITRSRGEKTWFCPAYRMDAAEYERRCLELESACAAVAAAIPEGASEFERELACHDAITRGCDYRYTGDDPDENTAYGALVRGKAACEGYARALLLLLDQQGIDSVVVTGNATNSAGDTSKHAWNKVRVDGDWYHVDITWNDPVSENGASSRGLLHSYFNLSDAEMGLSHELLPDDRPCLASKANFFAVRGLLFDRIDKDAEATLARALADAVNRGEYLLELRCMDKAGYESAVRKLFGEGEDEQRVYRILSNANLAADRKISSQKVGFTDVKSLYILQILPVVE